MAQVVSVNISEKKGMRKHPVPYIDVRLRHGIVGDAHAGDWHRQISLLAVESVDAMRADCPFRSTAAFSPRTSTPPASTSGTCRSGRSCASARRCCA